MTRSALLELLSDVERGVVPADIAAERLTKLEFEDLGDAKVDHHRSLRTGLPEVIFGQGKTTEQVVAIFGSLLRDGVDVLATRVSDEAAAAVSREHADAVWNKVAKTVSYRRHALSDGGTIAVVCAGTTDVPVAEEAAVTAETFGVKVSRVYDVGVAGLQRILAARETLSTADAVIVCAGMEGALPSVVGGLVGVPVIAVPTSVGYGASFGGVTALLGMLNSCSPNVVVVNIDNGFGAAYAAVLMVRRATVRADSLWGLT